MRGLADLLATFSSRYAFKGKGETPQPEGTCFFCASDLTRSDLYRRYRICPACRFHYSLSARERIELLADPGSFKEVNHSLVSLDPLSFSGRVPYQKRLSEAQRRTGLIEAVVTGVCSVAQHPAVLAVLDFGFLGGSMGCVVGEKMALAFELAIRKKLPLVAIATSGGARMQEGVLSLMQMAKTAAAAKRMDAAGLPFISVLANPTTGEVYGSFANLGDIVIAEPRALLGLAPLRVVQETAGQPLPEEAHTAEAHLKHGLVDMIADRSKLRESIALLLGLITSRPRRGGRRRRKEPYPILSRGDTSAWKRVELARHRQRPTSLDYIARITSSFVELHGDRLFGDDPAVVCGLADLEGQAVMIVGQEQGRGTSHRQGQAYPEGFRKAQRAMRLAAKFKLPLITLVDTPGAYPGLEAEERGVGHAVATTIAHMADLRTPVISVILGEGGSAGALALGVADRILMLENAIYSVISPEGAAALIYQDVSRAEEMAPKLKLTALDCQELGVVDRVIPEPPGGAHLNPEEAARSLKTFLLRELRELQGVSTNRLVRARYAKFRRMGEYSSYFKVAVAQEVAHLQELVRQRVGRLRERLRRQPKLEKAKADKVTLSTTGEDRDG